MIEATKEELDDASKKPIERLVIAVEKAVKLLEEINAK